MISQKNWEPHQAYKCLKSHFRDFVQSCTFTDNTLGCVGNFGDSMMTIILFLELHCDITAASLHVSSLQQLLAHFFIAVELIDDHLMMLCYYLFVLRIQRILGVFARRCNLKKIESLHNWYSSSNGVLLKWSRCLHFLNLNLWLIVADRWLFIN